MVAATVTRPTMMTLASPVGALSDRLPETAVVGASERKTGSPIVADAVLRVFDSFQGTQIPYLPASIVCLAIIKRPLEAIARSASATETDR